MAVAGWFIAEDEGVGFESERLIGAADFVIRLEPRHRQPSIDEDQRRVVLKLPIRCPLHPDQLRREHGEARIPDNDDGFRVGHRVVGDKAGVLAVPVESGSVRLPDQSWTCPV